jgi:hypothetical protein
VLPTKFWFIWLLCFRGEDFLEINQSAIRIACRGPQAILVCDWLIPKKSSPLKPLAWPNELKLGSEHLWKFLYKDCTCCPDPLTNMACGGDVC